jgi:hypothetical protein
MNYTKYLIQRPTYNGYEIESINLPNVVFLTGGKDDIGSGLVDGYLHYFAIVKDDFNVLYDMCSDFIVEVIHFNDEYSMLTIHNIKFIGDHPEIINPDETEDYESKLIEWNNQNDLSEYYIACYDNNRLSQMCQIDFIKSEFQIQAITVYRDITIKKSSQFSIDDIMDYNMLCVVVSGLIADTYWEYMCNSIFKYNKHKYSITINDFDEYYHTYLKLQDDTQSDHSILTDILYMNTCNIY